MEKSISFNSCSRLRRIQSLLSDNSLDAVLCVLGIDGNYNKGCLQFANYLLFNLFQNKQPENSNIPEHLVDDIILFIKPNAVHVYCNPLNRTYLLPYISHWNNLCLHCLTPTKFEDEEMPEDFKIRSFIAMVTDCHKIGVPYNDAVHGKGFSKFDVEKWPIIQAFGNEDYNKGGFFTLKYDKQKNAEVSILSAAKKALGMKKMAIPDAKGCTVMDITVDILPLYKVIDPAYLEILVTKHLPSFVNHWDTMMALMSLRISDWKQIKESKVCEPLKTYYNHGKMKDSNQDGSSSPFVLFGTNATKKSIQNLTSVKAGTLESTGIDGEPAVLMVCQEVSSCFPVICCRTYFFHNRPFKYNKKHQEEDTKYVRQIETLYLGLVDAVLQAVHVYKKTQNCKKTEEKAKEILQECKTRLNDENLKKHLERRDTIFFLLENLPTQRTNANQFGPGSSIKKIQMYIWDIPCKGKKGAQTCGSLGYGDTFIISSIETESNNDGSRCKNNEILILTSHIPRFHCWRMIPVDTDIVDASKSLELTEDFGKVMFDANLVDIFAINNQSKFSSTGHLHVLEKGIVILRPKQDPICLPNSKTSSMETYYQDSTKSLVFLVIEIAAADKADIIPTNFANSTGGFVVVFKPGTKAQKIFFSKLLPYWRKYGQITHVEDLEPEVKKMYEHLTNYETTANSQSSMPGFRCEWTLKQASARLPALVTFFDHLLVSTTFQDPVESDLLPTLLKKRSEVSTDSEAKDNKVIITLISGIRGSHKEKVSKVLSSLSAEHNGWMILDNPLEDTDRFDGEKLQNYLTTLIESQRQSMRGTRGDYDKTFRVIIVVPGYTETVNVARAILNHPDPIIRKQIKIGAVTVCINPENCFIEDRLPFPVLMNQCSAGWVNNIIFVTGKDSEILMKEIQILICHANPQVKFLTAHKGKFQSYDLDLILSENAFDSPSLCRARNLLHPNWKKHQASSSPLLPIEDVKLEFVQPLEKHSLKLKLAGLKGTLNGYPFHGNVFNVRGQVLFSGERQMSTFHYVTLSNQLDIQADPKPSIQKEKAETTYFVIFSGCRLDKETLKDWMRPCFKNIPEKKFLLKRRDLPQQIIKKVQEQHHLDALPSGWYYNGQQYVCMTGERSVQHPYLEDFLDKYTELTNAEINKFNEEIEKERKRLVFL